MDWIWIWLMVVAASLVVEFISLELVSCWCAIGGIVALILAACKVPLEIQLITFFAVSLAMLLGFRKLALKYLNKTDKTATNINVNIGKIVRLCTGIDKDNHGGTIKINGVTWTAISNNGKAIKKDTLVKITEINGNKFIVEKENN